MDDTAVLPVRRQAAAAPAPPGAPRAPAAPARRPLGAAARFVRDGLVATAHVSTDLWWGLLAFGVVAAVVAAGVSTLAVLVGLVLLVGALATARGFAALERARFAAVLGEVLPPLPRLDARGVWPWTRALVSSSGTWTALVWVLVLPLLGLVWSLVVLGLWSAAVALATLPLWQGATAGSASGGWIAGAGTPGAVAGVVAGLLLAVGALAAARLAASADVALARQLIGASPGQLQRQVLAQRVRTLTDTRADAVDAADAERRRIERDLHDGAQQRLVALALDLGMASAKLDDDPAAAGVLVRRAHAEAKAALAELRDLARGIHPAVLTDRGLDAALSALAARSPVPVAVDVDLPPGPDGTGGRCSPTAEASAYFVVAEALTNVARHSGATRASVSVRREGGALVVEVVDDGRGGADARGGTGLTGLAHRVAGVDGALRVSSPVGGPTRLRAELPCDPGAGARPGGSAGSAGVAESPGGAR